LHSAHTSLTTISGNDEHDDNDKNIVDNKREENHQDMLRAAATMPMVDKKPTAGAKTLGETMADYPPAASSIQMVSKIYGLGMEEKYTITKVCEGNADYYTIGFVVDGMLPKEGGHHCTLP
jgi:hypothetical protein